MFDYDIVVIIVMFWLVVDVMYYFRYYCENWIGCFVLFVVFDWFDVDFFVELGVVVVCVVIEF